MSHYDEVDTLQNAYAMDDVDDKRETHSYGDVEKYESSLDNFYPRNVLNNLFNTIPLRFFEQDKNLLNNIIRLLPFEDAKILITEIENYDTNIPKYYSKRIHKILKNSKIVFYDY